MAAVNQRRLCGVCIVIIVEWHKERYPGRNNVFRIGERGAAREDNGVALRIRGRGDRVVVFGDGGYSGGANKFMRATKQDTRYDASSSSLRKAGTQAFRHGKGRKRHCNMAFLDCHVESFYTPYKSNGKEGWVHEKSHTAFISSGNGIYGPRGWETEKEDDFTENK